MLLGGGDLYLHSHTQTLTWTKVYKLMSWETESYDNVPHSWQWSSSDL
jgi:hypothetical protein